MVDDSGVLQGIITVDDVVEVFEEEASQDLSESVMGRGRPLAIIVGLAVLVTYIWALTSLGARQG